MQLYLDESGNTGADWLNKEQPYFVYGGWLINDNNKKDAEALLKKSFPNSKAIELKSKVLWDRQRDKLVDFIENMMNQDWRAIPVILIVNKKYMIAARLVETCFDPMYNHKLNSRMSYPSDLKIELTDSLSKNTSVIEGFSELIRCGTIEIDRMRSILELVQKHFRNTKGVLSHFADTIDGISDKDLKNMVLEFEVLTNYSTEKRWNSLVIPSLQYLILILNAAFGEQDTCLQIKADNLMGFSDVFERFDKISCNLKKSGVIKFDVNVTMCDSKTEPLIQAADLLSGFISRSLIESDKVSSNHGIMELWNRLYRPSAICSNEVRAILDSLDENESKQLMLSKLTGEKVPLDHPN